MQRNRCCPTSWVATVLLLWLLSLASKGQLVASITSLFMIVFCLEIMTITTNSDKQKAARGPFAAVVRNGKLFPAKHPWELSFLSLGPSLFQPVFTSSSHLNQRQAALGGSDSGHLGWSLACATEAERLAGDTPQDRQDRPGLHDKGDNGCVGKIS